MDHTTEVVEPSPRSDERGATAVEYGLMVALIAVFIIGAVTLFGVAVNDLFTRIPDEVWYGSGGRP